MNLRRAMTGLAALCVALAGCGQALVEHSPLATNLAASLGPDLLAADVRSITYEDRGVLDVLPNVVSARPGAVVVVEFAKGPSVRIDAMNLRTLSELRVDADSDYKLDLDDGRQSPLLSVHVAVREPENPPHVGLVASELDFAARNWLEKALERRRQLAANAASWN